MDYLILRRRTLRWAIAAWLGGFGWIAPALAQPPDASEGIGPVPGWVFTPAVRFAGSFDDNATYRGHGDLITRDYLTTVGPTFDLGFTGRRSHFMLDYSGAFLMYRSLQELNSFDQSASTELRVRTTRHVTWFGRSSFALAPTTDMLELGGIPFMRMESRRCSRGERRSMRATTFSGSTSRRNPPSRRSCAAAIPTAAPWTCATS
jgi:hypothetical protein